VEVQNVDNMIIITEDKIILTEKMISAEYKIVEHDKYLGGYFLTPYDLRELVRDFQADFYDGFVSNDISYIEEWLKKHDHIEK
jgi:hypothetical protein